MPKIWNLTTNDFEEVDQATIDKGHFSRTCTLEGETVFVETNLFGPSLGDTAFGRITKHEGLADELEKAIVRTWEACSDVIDIAEHSLEYWREGFVSDANADKNVLFWVVVCYIVQRFAERKRYDIRKEIYRHAFWARHDGRTLRPSLISKAFHRTILATAQPKGSKDEVELFNSACVFFGLYPTVLMQDSLSDNVASIYTKAFVKDGIGFVVGRIQRPMSSRLAREGVQANSPERAELLLLYKLVYGAAATNSGGHLDIYSSQMNIVNWLNGESNPTTHAELRADILDGLEAFETVEAHRMDEETRAAYKRKVS